MSELALSKLGGRPEATPYSVVVNTGNRGGAASNSGGYTLDSYGWMMPRGKIVKPSESGSKYIAQHNSTGYTVGKVNTFSGLKAVGSCYFFIGEDTNYVTLRVNGVLGIKFMLFCPYIGSSAKITVPNVDVYVNSTKIISGELNIVAMYGVSPAVYEEYSRQIKNLFGVTDTTSDGGDKTTTKAVYAYFTNATFYSGYKDASTNFALSVQTVENSGESMVSGLRLDRYDGIDPPFEYPQ